MIQVIDQVTAIEFVPLGCTSVLRVQDVGVNLIFDGINHEGEFHEEALLGGCQHKITPLRVTNGMVLV